MSHTDVCKQYLLALEHYVAHRNETGLHTAYQLGRTALTEGIHSLDIVRVHHDQLSHMLHQSSEQQTATDITAAASVFLAECLSSYEMALSGFREAITKLEMEIGERQKAELALRESEEYFRSLIENSLDIVTIIDRDGVIRYESPSIERVLGYKQGELVGSNVFDLIHADDRTMIQRNLDPQNQTPGYSISVEFRCRHKNGTWHILEGNGRNLIGVPGVRGILVNSRDITEKKKLQDSLDDAARQRARDLQAFARLTQQAQEEERHRIARELHDDVCQSLSALRLHLNVFEDDIPKDKRSSRTRLHELAKQIDNLIEDVRRISANLRPTALDHFGLVTALRLLSLEFQKRHAMEICLETCIGDRNGFGEQIDIAIYRIAQEALMNTAKHSAATKVYVVLSYIEPKLKLVIRDDGRGFVVNKVGHNQQQGMGLMSMRERAELLGGTCTIKSIPHKGVTVSIEIPISA